jgi:hypothetical protein
VMSWAGRNLAALLAAAALALAFAFAGGAVVRADDGVAAALPQAQAAVGAAVQATGAVYAGDCAATQSPRDLGAVCSKFVAAQNGTLAFETGLTFSEFDHWMFVEPADGGWRVTASIPLDDSSVAIPWPRAAAEAPLMP